MLNQKYTEGFLTYLILLYNFWHPTKLNVTLQEETEAQLQCVINLKCSEFLTRKKGKKDLMKKNDIKNIQ